MHLAFAITTYIVKPAQSAPVECSFMDGGELQVIKYDLNSTMNEEMKFLRWIHLACFFLILWSNYKECRDLESHFTVFLKIVSVICYTGIILKA